MPIEYSEDEALQKVVTDTLARAELHELATLRDNEVKFQACFLLKTNNEGEEQKTKGEAIVVKRATDLERLWIPAHFFLVVDFPTWNESNEQQREILMFDALTSVEAFKTDDGVKVSKVKPVKINPRTIARYGAHTELLSDVGQLLQKGSKKFVEQF